MAEYSLAIVGGRVIEETGNPWFCAGMGVKNGRIAAPGRTELSIADQVIDAIDMVVDGRGKR